MALEAIRYSAELNRLEVLDQLRLPFEIHYDRITSCKDAHDYIKSMKVRGAPVIAIVAILSLAIEVKDMLLSRNFENDVVRHIKDQLDYLITSRPTAVNLADAVRKVNVIINKALESMEITTEQIIKIFIEVAESMLQEDVLTNKSIGKNGAKWILSQSSSSTVSVLTHCNTGSLATAGYGTALGVIRSLNDVKSLRTAYCTETRPYNQGSRLTAFELVHDQIPACLITDSMASALFSLKGSNENLVAVVVGADRVAANGDTANKIGTYNLAITAKYHGVKFVVAAPRTSIDMHTFSGQDIVIEQRPSQEMTVINGPSINSNVSQTVKIAAEGIQVWNPAFDVTPAYLIDAIVTEVGVAEKDKDGHFHLDQFMSNGI